MPKKTVVRERAREWVQRLSAGTHFSNTELYDHLTANHPRECDERGHAKSEPRFRNDARWAIQDAKRAKEVRDLGVVGHHQRI